MRNQQGMQPLEKAHRTNLEEPELKIIHKDKWPLPTASTNFIRSGSSSSGIIIDTGAHIAEKSAQKTSLFFGSSVPSLLLKKKPIHFDIDNCQYEVLEIKDLLYTHDFIKENLLE